MLTGSTAISTTLLLSVCLLATVHSQGSVRVLFGESDATGAESASLAEAPVSVLGDNTEILTVIVIPLTRDMYLANPGMYRNSCDSIIADAAAHSIDPAEESDFVGPVETEIQANATDAKGFFELNVGIGIIDDSIRETDEYFLLFLNASQSPPVDDITITSNRDCIRVTITADQDSLSISYVRLIDPIVVSEDAGTVEIIRVEKQGLVEKPVEITFSGADPNTVMFSPATFALQPNETSAIVSITLVDDEIAQDDNKSFTVSADSMFGSDSIPITIRENDRAVVGFDQTEVTVTEGGTVTLSTSFKNNITLRTFQRTEFFQVSTQQGVGNATDRHYTSLSIPFYFVGDPIEIQIMDDNTLERPRQFEVKLRYPVSTPLVIIKPDTVIVTIKDNDRVVVGFDQIEVTVIEGETITLSTSIKNNITLQNNQSTLDFFQVYTQQGLGNATESHYTSILNGSYVLGDQIHVQTTKGDELERPRQFEVKLTYPVSTLTPLVVVQPDTVIVTIKDNNGEPNKPSVTKIELTKDNLTITWDIDKHELRPVDTYVIKIQITGSRNQDSDFKDDNNEDGDSRRAEIVEFNTTISAANVNCKPNTTKDVCLLTVKREINEQKMYNVTVCAKNDFGIICSDPTVILPKPSPIKPTSRLPTGSIVGIVFGVIVAILVCCLLWMLIALIICCTCCEREKVYNPEKKEKENEKLRNEEMYTKVDLSESAAYEYDSV